MKIYTSTIPATALWLIVVVGSASAEAPGGASAKGPLDKENIRRVVRRHIHEVKACYESELDKKKDLAGRVLVQFTISAEGKVLDAKVQETSLGSPVAEKCIADAVLGWEFPSSKGKDPTVVSYPFLLQPGGDK